MLRHFGSIKLHHCRIIQQALLQLLDISSIMTKFEMANDIRLQILSGKLFVIRIGQVQSKLIYTLVSHELESL